MVMRTTRYTVAVLGLVALTAGSVMLSAQGGLGRGRGNQSYQMTGTYELDTTRGDDPQRTADFATRGLPPDQRDRTYQSLIRRLQPPTAMAIDRQGNRITMISSSGPRTSFDVDGRSHYETSPYGRQMTTHAQFIGGNQLSVTTTGDRNSSFVVTFQPQNYGDVLFVTRRLDNDSLRAPVTVRSYYRRTSPEPRWDLYTDTRYDRGGGYGPPPRPRAFTLPEGMHLNAVLDTEIDTRRARSGERFTMTVQGPAEYRDGRIDGTIARIDQGHNMYVDFDTIRLRDGRTTEFDAILSTVRTPRGDTFRVNSSTLPDQGNSRTDAAIAQGAIGAGLGAIIGAIAGGGKGAAIGAVVGGAGGAILAQGSDQYISLPPGTQVTIIVTAPRYRMP
jgi:hypothetical protein